MTVLEFLPQYQRNLHPGMVVQFRPSGMIYLSPALLREMDKCGVDRKSVRYRIEFTPDQTPTSGCVRFIPDENGYALNAGRNMFTRRLINVLPPAILGRPFIIKRVNDDCSFDVTYEIGGN